jgi:hypothetical protein
LRQPLEGGVERNIGGLFVQVPILRIYRKKPKAFIAFGIANAHSIRSLGVSYA